MTKKFPRPGEKELSAMFSAKIKEIHWRCFFCAHYFEGMMKEFPVRGVYNHHWCGNCEPDWAWPYYKDWFLYFKRVKH